MKNIRNDVKENKLNKAYLIYGEEEFLRDYYSKLICDAVYEADTKDFNYLKISYEKPSESVIEDFVNSYPFLSDRKVLYIKESGILRKSTEADKKLWLAILKNMPEYLTIVFSESEIDKRNAIYKALSDTGYTTQISYQKKPDLMIWCNKILKANKKSMEDKDIEYLLDICPPGMINIKAELDKLMLYKKENPLILRADIDTMVAKSVQNQVFVMAEDMALGKLDEAVKKLENLKSLKCEPIEIISAIFAKFNSYRKVKILRGTPIYEIASKTGQREYFIKSDLALLKNVSLEYIDSVLYKCENADYRIKTGQAIPWSELEMIVMTSVSL